MVAHRLPRADRKHTSGGASARPGRPPTHSRSPDVPGRYGIRKSTLIRSCTALLAVHVTRIRAVVVAGPVTVHTKLPDALRLVTDAASTLHVVRVRRASWK